MAKVICLFNHKGGVSKTTTTFNLGWMIANLGKRVLLVDTDPQCNLTGMVLGFKEQMGMDIESLKSAVESPNNIRDGLAPAFESRPVSLQPVNCIEIPGNDHLFLLPGHLGLSEYEVTLGIAQELSSSLVTLRNLPGSLRYLIDLTAKKYAIDLVLIDMSPSLGSINQNALTTSDFFIIPMHPDFFSAMAIESLAKTIPRWVTWARTAAGIPVLREADYPFPDLKLRFMGSVVQKYRPRGGGPSRAFEQWIQQLEVGLRDRLLPILAANDLLLASDAYHQAGFSPEKPLLQMADFNSLIARSQEHQVPVYALSADQLEVSGAVFENTKEAMDNFRMLFEEAAKRVIFLASYAACN